MRSPRNKLLVNTASLLLAGMLAACGEAGSNVAQEKPVIPVLAQRVSYSAPEVERSLSATIQARVVSDHAFRVEGKITRRLVNVGDRVVRDQPLAVLDDSDLKLQLTQANAEADAARSVLAQQEAEEARLGKLLKGGWVAASAFDRQKAAADEARGRIRRAEQAVVLAGNAVSYATLVADGDGVVIRTAAEPGQVIAPGQPAITIAREGEMEALVAVPEDEVSDVSQGEASVILWSNSSRQYTAKLRELSPVADPATRTYAARFTILDPDSNMLLGMSAELRIRKPGPRGATLPIAALFDQGNGPSVWRVDPGKGSLMLKPVKVTSYGTSSVQIADGLDEGEYVVVLGAQKLDAARKVRLVENLKQ